MKIFNKNEWKKVKLGDVFDLQMGKTPLRENKLYWDKGEYHWISISDMNFSEKYISSTKEKITELAVKKSGIKIIPKNTVIMSFKLSIGKVKIVNKDIYSNEAIMAFIPKTNNYIDENFLYYSLKSVRWNEGINKAVKGLTLNKALISQKEIFLPNLAIQKEIASNLDSIADFLDLRRKQLNYLEELSKSLFTTMFGDIKTNNKNWEIKKLGEVIQTQYGTSKKATSIVTEFPILRMNNITYSGEMDYRDLKYIELSDNEKEKFLLKKGELLFNRTNSKELVGKTGLFELDTPMAFAGYLIKMKPSNLIHSKFLLFFMNSEFMKKLLYNKAKNIVGMANINAKELEDFSIILPPIELQNKFAERIEKIEKLKFEIEKSIEIAQNLYDSLISKYFDN